MWASPYNDWATGWKTEKSCFDFRRNARYLNSKALWRALGFNQFLIQKAPEAVFIRVKAAETWTYSRLFI